MGELVEFRAIVCRYDSCAQSNATRYHVAVMLRSESTQEHCLNYDNDCLCFHHCGVILKNDDRWVQTCTC